MIKCFAYYATTWRSDYDKSRQKIASLVAQSLFKKPKLDFFHAI